MSIMISLPDDVVVLSIGSRRSLKGVIAVRSVPTMYSMTVVDRNSSCKRYKHLTISLNPNTEIKMQMFNCPELCSNLILYDSISSYSLHNYEA